jgi:hypothetical protein
MGLDDFRGVARQSGLPLTDEQVEILFAGYGKLQRMLESLERPSSPATAPALLFRPTSRP